MDVKVALLAHACPGLPDYATSGSAGVDLVAANFEPIWLGTLGDRAMIPTGLTFEIPRGYEAQIRPRSGLAANHGITVLNTPGTIDSDYRGEIKVILVNLSTNKFCIQRGMRIAQMVFAPVHQVSFTETDSLSETDRGEGGFGSTGVQSKKEPVVIDPGIKADKRRRGYAAVIPIRSIQVEEPKPEEPQSDGAE